MWPEQSQLITRSTSSHLVFYESQQFVFIIHKSSLLRSVLILIQIQYYYDRRKEYLQESKFAYSEFHLPRRQLFENSSDNIKEEESRPLLGYLY
jgi:hypothetical protein